VRMPAQPLLQKKSCFIEAIMSYVKPGRVDSPRNSWRLGKVLYDGGENDWAAAEGQWDRDGRWEAVVALRCNCSSTNSKIGNPQSRGLPTWVVVPDEPAGAVRSAFASKKSNRRASRETSPKRLCAHGDIRCRASL
jgi:hypothetical protein